MERLSYRPVDLCESADRILARPDVARRSQEKLKELGAVGCLASISFWHQDRNNSLGLHMFRDWDGLVDVDKRLSGSELGPMTGQIYRLNEDVRDFDERLAESPYGFLYRALISPSGNIFRVSHDYYFNRDGQARKYMNVELEDDSLADSSNPLLSAMIREDLLEGINLSPIDFEPKESDSKLVEMSRVDLVHVGGMLRAIELGWYTIIVDEP